MVSKESGTVDMDLIRAIWNAAYEKGVQEGANAATEYEWGAGYLPSTPDKEFKEYVLDEFAAGRFNPTSISDWENI